jgi:hypothetical protein
MFESSETVCSIEAHRQRSYFVQCGIDLVEAAEVHMRWRDRLQRCIDGGNAEDISFCTAAAADECGLGRWLHGTGHAKYGSIPSFRRLEADHAEFHRVAGLILNRVKKGEPAAAEALLKNEFSQATRRILIALNELNDALR